MRSTLLALTIALLAGMVTASAQTWPSKPIRLINPFPPGGGATIIGRLMAQELTERLGQSVVFDNRGGAGGIIGMEIAARAAPDGYTFTMATASTVTIHPLLSKTPFDPIKDFSPVSHVSNVPLLLVIHPSVTAKSTKEFLALLKSQPGKLNFASSGNAAAPHLAGESFKLLTGVQMQHVPYKGSAPALTDLIGGQVQLMFDSMPSAMPHVRSGKCRALAVTTAIRSPALPDLPTLAESGVPGFDISTWYGLWAPKGTSREIVQKLADETARILKLAEVRERYASLGAEPVGSSPDEFAAYCRSELAKWSKIVKESGAKAD